MHQPALRFTTAVVAISDTIIASLEAGDVVGTKEMIGPTRESLWVAPASARTPYHLVHRLRR